MDPTLGGDYLGEPARDPASSKSNATPPEVADALPSDRFGKYVRTVLLGAGGMGEVWKAWDTELNRWVAVKFLKGGDDDEIARFKREAHIAGKLTHPNIAAIYDIGQDRDRHFIAMQFVEGSTLKRFPRGDTRTLVKLVRDAARAVAYAHDQGIIHRDLKPENLMVVRSTKPATARASRKGFTELQLYVMDFGLARAAEGASELSVSGMVVGTPAFMSPEQARGDRLDARADVYSLGATLYDLLTGKPPFKGATPIATLALVLSGEIVPPRRIVPSIAEDLETVLLKSLEKDGGRRYATAVEFADDLDRWLDGEPIMARRSSVWYVLSKKAARNRALVGVALAALVVIAGLIAYPPIARRLDEGRHAAQIRAESAAARAAVERVERLIAAADVSAFAAAESAIARFGESATLHHAAGRAALVRKEPDRAMPHFSRAYLLGVKSPNDAEREAAAAGLSAIGAFHDENADIGRARIVYQTLLTRFPVSTAAPVARFRLGLTFEATGDASAMLYLFEGVLRDGKVPPGDLRRARDAVDAAHALLPDTQVDIPEASFEVGDLDGDGKPEIVLFERTGRIAVLSGLHFERRVEGPLIAEAEKNEARPVIVDLTGDGVPEIIAPWGVQAGGGFVILNASLKETARVSTPSRPVFFAFVDLDGDGERELVVATSYYAHTLIVYSVARDCTVRPITQASCQSQILGLLPLPAPDRGTRLAVAFGPWSGWRLSLLSWDRDQKTFYERESVARRLHAQALCAADGRLWFTATRPASHVLAIRKQGGDADLLADGIYGVPTGQWAAPPERVEGDWRVVHFAPATLAKRRFFVCQEEMDREDGQAKRLRLLPRPGSDGIPRELGINGTLIGVADLDGDGEDEIIIQAGKAIHLLGFGQAVEPKPPTIDPIPEAIEPGRDLLSLGLFGEPADAHLTRGFHFMEQNDWETAGKQFEKVNGAKRAVALRRLAECLQQRRQWKELSATLEELSASLDVDPIGRRELAAWRAWVRKVAELKLVETVESSERLLCENPLLTTSSRGEWELHDLPYYHTSLGIPMRYGGGPFRIEWDLSVRKDGWASGVHFGLQGPAELSLTISYGGASDFATSETHLFWKGPQGANAVSFAPPDAMRPPLGQWLHVAIEYVPDAGKATLTITDLGGKTFTRTVDIAHPLETGLYRFGKCRSNQDADYADLPCVHLVRNMQLFAADASTRFEAPAPSTAQERFEAANTEFLLGHYDRAIDGYDRAATGADSTLAVRIRFFRGLARFRQGDRQEGIDDLKAAEAMNPREFGLLLGRVRSRMMSEEQALFPK